MPHRLPSQPLGLQKLPGGCSSMSKGKRKRNSQFSWNAFYIFASDLHTSSARWLPIRRPSISCPVSPLRRAAAIHEGSTHEGSTQTARPRRGEPQKHGRPTQGSTHLGAQALSGSLRRLWVLSRSGQRVRLQPAGESASLQASYVPFCSWTGEAQQSWAADIASGTRRLVTIGGRSWGCNRVAPERARVTGLLL